MASSTAAAMSVGESLRFELGEGLAVEWRLDRLMRAADAADPAADPAWELHGEPDWARFESLRLVVGAAGESALALAVARPTGAADHGSDGIAVALIGPDGTDTADDALLSTEYDPDGRVRRLGVEVWLEGGAGMRVAADRAGEAATTIDRGLSREATPLSVRFDGERGGGVHELIRPA
jgi:hypothetical protein